MDRRIWNNELDPFVPKRVFDVHTHYYRWEHNTDPDKQTGPEANLGRDFPNVDRAYLDSWDTMLLPGRRVLR